MLKKFKMKTFDKVMKTVKQEQRALDEKAQAINKDLEDIKAGKIETCQQSNRTKGQRKPKAKEEAKKTEAGSSILMQKIG